MDCFSNIGLLNYTSQNEKSLPKNISQQNKEGFQSNI